MVVKSLVLLNITQQSTAQRDLTQMMLRNTSMKRELSKDIPMLKHKKLLSLFHSWKRNAISLFQLLLKNQFTKVMLMLFNARLLLKVPTDPQHSLLKKFFLLKELLSAQISS
jgi:hypothetical protein